MSSDDTAGYSRARDYVIAVRSHEPVETVVRLKTPLGRQGQMDFTTFSRQLGRSRNDLSSVVAVTTTPGRQDQKYCSPLGDFAPRTELNIEMRTFSPCGRA